MTALMARPCKQVSRLLTNTWFWILTFVLGWIVMVTLLIAQGHGTAESP